MKRSTLLPAAAFLAAVLVWAAPSDAHEHHGEAPTANETSELPSEHTGVLTSATITTTVFDAETPGDCKNGGWETFGFSNQGQCLRFVNTGNDSR